jgi:hypothetical protein
MYLVVELSVGDPGELVMGTTIDENAKNYYLRYLYFGNLDDPVGTAIRRSYRDFNRTLRGFARVANSDEIRVRARETLRDGLTALKSSSIAGQDEFDNWHRELGARLSSDFESFHFTVGHGQKWINMSIKYLFLLRLSDVEQYWNFCHVPIDRIIIQRLEAQGKMPPKLGHVWSAVDSYERYLNWQIWFREELPGIPMDEEFRLWMGQGTG